jgi:hypothetical protein
MVNSDSLTRRDTVILVSSFKLLIHELSDLFGDTIRLCYSIKSFVTVCTINMSYSFV